MQYELYIDIFFLENFMMDFFVLMAVKRALHNPVSGYSVCGGAFCGALLSSILLVIPISIAGKLALSHVFVNHVMLFTGLKIRNIRECINSVISLYIFSFLIGGIITCMESFVGEYLKVGSLFFGVSICSYVVFRKVLDYLERLFKLPMQYCRVELALGENTSTVDALIDSGNNLEDGITGKPVHIITAKAIKKLISVNEEQKIRYVPYHTIQEEEGILPVIKFDRMKILGEKEKIISDPIIGISPKEEFEGGKFEMILNPKDC